MLASAKNNINNLMAEKAKLMGALSDKNSRLEIRNKELA